jgi:uncharacterized protein YjiS (DUF1127 family)
MYYKSNYGPFTQAGTGNQTLTVSLNRLVAKSQKRRLIAREIEALQKLTDRELCDRGLSHGEIEFVKTYASKKFA